MNEIEENWVDLPRKFIQRQRIMAISDRGRARRGDGTIEILPYGKIIRVFDKHVNVSHIIAEHFLITVKRPDQNFVDHITHYTTEYNVNDVLNLRWCTQEENNSFEEAKSNHKKGARRGMDHPMHGRCGKLSPVWKYDDVCQHQVYQRALRLYKAGKISEEEFQPYRDAWAEVQRERKARRHR